MMVSRSSRFYLGLLVSSVGSFAFNICLIAFMTRAGFDLLHVSLILGMQRLVPILVTGMLGHMTDHLSPRRVIVALEIAAALATLGILSAWSFGPSAYPWLLMICLVKASIMAFQTGSRAKLAKEFSDGSYASDSGHAIWLNKATQGATLFAGVLAWPMIRYGTFEVSAIVDLLTFIANGMLVWSIRTPAHASIDPSNRPKAPIIAQFLDLYRHSPRAAVLDLILALSMMGTMSFTTRLAGASEQWLAMLVASFGLSVWLSGLIESSGVLKDRPLLLWCGLGAAYCSIGLATDSHLCLLALALAKDTFYWLLFHRISAHIQADTPSALVGGVTSARTCQMVLILASGEILVGAWSNVLPVFIDGLWRGVFCLGVAAILALPRLQPRVKYGYARL